MAGTYVHVLLGIVERAACSHVEVRRHVLWQQRGAICAEEGHFAVVAGDKGEDVPVHAPCAEPVFEFVLHRDVHHDARVGVGLELRVDERALRDIGVRGRLLRRRR